MDRRTDMPSRRGIVPVVALALAAAASLLIPLGTRSSGIETQPVEAPAATGPAEDARPGTFTPPELFHPLGPGHRLPPLSDQIRLVLATGFPSDETTMRLGEGKGPAPAATTPPKASQATNVPRDTDARDGRPKDTPAPDHVLQPPAGDATEAPGESSPAEPAAGPASPRTFRQPQASLLLPSHESTSRSEELENIARQADRQIRHGFELASREAYFAARSEFVTALRLVAQGLDAEHQTTLHSRSLAAGLTAVKEAEDFIPTGSRVEADLDLAGIIGSHRTPVLKDAVTDTLTPLLALKCYFTFAQEQLAAAAGREVASSIALHALGKLHGALARNKSVVIRAGEPKAMTFYQAALLVCPRNYMAANDLGVLLAQCGNYADARAMLEHSLSIQQPSAGWHNLAVVYQQLGQVELARRASWQAEITRRAEDARAGATANPANQMVRWLDSETFARSHGEAPTTQQPPSTAARTPQTTTRQPSPAATPTLARTPAPAGQPATSGR